MKIYKYDVVFQEIPHEISLAFYVCGCPVRCKGCHSPELWNASNGILLGENLYRDLMTKYKGKATCILFLGGEWYPDTLINYLQIAHSFAFKTALYSGLDDVPSNIRSELDYLKVGPWIANKGGLTSPTTNQILWDIKNNQSLNHLFIQQNFMESSICLSNLPNNK